MEFEKALLSVKQVWTWMFSLKIYPPVSIKQVWMLTFSLATSVILDRNIPSDLAADSKAKCTPPIKKGKGCCTGSRLIFILLLTDVSIIWTLKKTTKANITVNVSDFVNLSLSRLIYWFQLKISQHWTLHWLHSLWIWEVAWCSLNLWCLVSGQRSLKSIKSSLYWGCSPNPNYWSSQTVITVVDILIGSRETNLSLGHLSFFLLHCLLLPSWYILLWGIIQCCLNVCKQHIA